MCKEFFIVGTSEHRKAVSQCLKDVLPGRWRFRLGNMDSKVPLKIDFRFEKVGLKVALKIDWTGKWELKVSPADAHRLTQVLFLRAGIT